MKLCLTVFLAWMNLGFYSPLHAAESKWTPPDSEPFGYFWFGHNVAVEYQFRIEFFEFASETRIEPEGMMKVRVLGAKQEIVPWGTPMKTIFFRRRFDVLRRVSGAPSGEYIAVCTNAIESRYSAANSEEFAKSGFDRRGIEWLSPRFDLDDFCGVLKIDGNIAFRFPIKQRVPKPLAKLILLDADGTVGVAIGQVKNFEHEDGATRDVGDFTEALVWRPGAEMRRLEFAHPLRENSQVYDALKSKG